MSEDPVTLWLEELKNSDQLAADKLWSHFVDRIQGVARRKLSQESRRVYDEEDAALSAFHSVCSGISSGRFPDLQDRDCLWKLILVITSRKVMYRHRYERQERRDIHRNCSDYIFKDAEGRIFASEIDNVPSKEPTPEFAAEFLETCNTLFLGLGDEGLEQVVALRMEGCTDTEIAARLNCSRRTVQRRLEIIRRHLLRMEPSIDPNQ